MSGGLEKFLPKSRFMRSVSVLTTAEALSQVVVIASSPILMRLYSPADFGAYAVFVSVLTLSLIVTTLRFEMAIPLPEHENAAVNLLGLVIAITAIMSLLSTLFVFLFSDMIAAALKVPDIRTWLLALPAMLLLSGFYQAYYYYSGIRHKKYGVIATTRLSRSATMVSVQILCQGFGAVGLLLGQFAGTIVGLRPLIRSARRVARPVSLFRLRFQKMKEQALRYRDFPLWSTWAAALNAAGVHLPTVFFAALFSPTAAGLYALTHRVLSLPVSVIGQAVANVFLSEAAQAHRDGRLANLVRGIVISMMRVSIPPAVMLILAGPILFELVFGSPWRQAGEISTVIAPWLLLVFVTTSVSRSFSVLARNRYAMMLEAAMLLVRIAAIGLGYHLSGGDFFLTVSAFAAASAIMWLIMLISCLRLVGIRLAPIAGDMLKLLPTSGLICLPVAVAVATAKPWLVVGACVFAGGLHYFFLTTRWKENWSDGS